MNYIFNNINSAGTPLANAEIAALDVSHNPIVHGQIWRRGGAQIATITDGSGNGMITYSGMPVAAFFSVTLPGYNTAIIDVATGKLSTVNNLSTLTFYGVSLAVTGAPAAPGATTTTAPTTGTTTATTWLKQYWWLALIIVIVVIFLIIHFTKKSTSE